MWKFSKVDISDVISSVDRANFSEIELENLANLIVEMEGLMRPAILKKAGFEKGYDRFQVISGDLEYHASVLAKQKNPDIEMINAFVVESESENIAIRQLQALSETVVNPVIHEKTEGKTDETEKSEPQQLDLVDLDRRFQEFQVAIEQKIKSLEDRHERDIQQLRKEYQEAISSIEPKIAKEPESEPPLTSKPTILEVLNTYSEKQLASMGFGATLAKKIIKQRPFNSFSDMKSKIATRWTTEILVNFIDYYESL